MTQFIADWQARTRPAVSWLTGYVGGRRLPGAARFAKIESNPRSDEDEADSHQRHDKTCRSATARGGLGVASPHQESVR